MARKELGRVGHFRYGGHLYEEFLPELRGIRGIETYREMSENDDVISGILFAIEMLIRQCDFSVEPGGDSEADKRAAEFVEECMGDMEQSWTDTISEIISFLTYGWSWHEIVYKRRKGRTRNPVTNSKYEDNLIGWQKLPIRSQDTLWEWEFDEKTDELIGMIQSPPPYYGQIHIPKNKSLHFVTKSRKNNPEGRSILRGAYRAWYFKKRVQEIEGIGLERDLAGFPVLKAPEGLDLWDTTDPDMVEALATAEAIVKGIRQDSRAGLVLPFGWELELLSSGNRKTFDTNQIIERYDHRIATTVLADFVLLGQDAVGSFALSSDKTRIFALAMGTFLDVICETFNTQGIPRLIDINGDAFAGITDYPVMTHGDIEDRNLEQFATFVEKMVGAGIVVPDEELEDYVRQEGGLPERLGERPPQEEINAQQAQAGREDDGSGDATDDEADAQEAAKAKEELGR